MFQSGLWDEVDRGVWTEQEVLDAFFARVPQYREDIQRIYDNIGTSLIKNAYADNWIDEGIEGAGTACIVFVQLRAVYHQRQSAGELYLSGKNGRRRLFL